MLWYGIMHYFDGQNFKLINYHVIEYLVEDNVKKNMFISGNVS